jgi:hypothetical protein
VHEKGKFYHDRINWEKHVREIQETGVQASGNTGFDECFCIRPHHFDHLHDAIKEYISVVFKRSMASTQGNDPIYPELAMAYGLRFLGLNSNILGLKYTYGMSKSSVKQVINMFLAAVDNNTDCSELQIELLDPANVFELNKPAGKFAKILVLYQLMDGCLGEIDGWLACTEKPYNASTRVDYYSGYYQYYDINVQAMCDPNLIFLFLQIATPGKVIDMRAFNRYNQLLKWLEALPIQYYIAGDNTYSLSQKVLILFSGAKKYNGGNRTFNFYLSQLRVRIDMTFGLLTAEWQILRRVLN